MGSDRRFPAAKNRSQKEDDKNEKENLGDRRGSAGDDAEAEDARNQGDDEKEDGVA